MKVKYFHDTGTALIEFSTHPIAETKEINENIYIYIETWILRVILWQSQSNMPTYMRIYLICFMSR